MHKNPVSRALAAITVGDAVVVENLLMFPLIAGSGSDGLASDADSHDGSGPDLDPSQRHALDYLVLDDALKTGAVQITEVSEQGSVPELLVINRGPRPVLIVDGEELLGAKQNRVVNLTILVPAKSTLTIPVSCVEAGRWRARSRSFTAAPRTQYASGRAMRMAQVTRSIVTDGERTSDQVAVWAHIAEKSARMRSTSATSAMGTIFTSHAASLDAYVAGFLPAAGQSGAVFAIGNQIVGFDLFDSACTFGKLLPKLVRSYAVDAVDAMDVTARAKRDRRTNPGVATRHPIAHLVPGFLGAVAAATQQRCTSIGVGDDVRLTASGLVGAALLVGERVVHVGAFTS